MTARPPVTGYRCEFCGSTDPRVAHYAHCPTIGDDGWAEWLHKLQG